MIFVDEFQHILDRDTLRVLNAVTDFLKDIINQSNIPMILIGQKGEAEPILQTNPQLSRRVGTPRYMTPFPWDRSQSKTTAEFRTLMESIDLELPLDPSGWEAWTWPIAFTMPPMDISAGLCIWFAMPRTSLSPRAAPPSIASY
nr:TniB family NTP-binding protein [Ktedonobacter robiniae]